MKPHHAADSLQAHVEQLFHELPEPISPQDLPQLLQLGLTQMIAAALAKERRSHLANLPQDRANGYVPQRTPHVGATPVGLERARTRQGSYPALLPKHRRNLLETYQELIQNVLLGITSENHHQTLSSFPGRFRVNALEDSQFTSKQGGS